MKNLSNNTAFYVLLIFQAIIAFGLGIAGNKLADLVNIQPVVLVFGTIVLLSLSFILTIKLLRFENHSQSSPTTDSSTFSGLLSTGAKLTYKPTELSVR